MTLNVVNMVVGARRAGLRFLTNCSRSTGIFTTSQPSLGFTEDGLKRRTFPGLRLVGVRGERSAPGDWLEATGAQPRSAEQASLKT